MSENGRLFGVLQNRKLGVCVELLAVDHSLGRSAKNKRCRQVVVRPNATFDVAFADG